MLGKAIAIAAEGFKNKKDKAGKPYILHCLTVMNNLHSDDEEENSIAVLHDAVEDEIYVNDKLVTLQFLRDEGFTERVVSGVDILTHKKEDTYDIYIRKIANSNRLDVVRIKKSDLEHNSQITRLKGLTKKDFDRMETYHRSYIYLSSI